MGYIAPLILGCCALALAQESMPRDDKSDAPLAEVGFDNGVLVAGETAGFAGALQRGSQHEREGASLQVAAYSGGFVAARRGEGNVGETGMGAGAAPFGFAMTD